MFGIGPTEVLIVSGIALLLFSSQFPGKMRGIGKGVRPGDWLYALADSRRTARRVNRDHQHDNRDMIWIWQLFAAAMLLLGLGLKAASLTM